jgi:aminoglycoside/choline kinase family phosphotransferase
MHGLLSPQSPITGWLADEFQHPHFAVTPITGDASFRCYYRVQLANSSFIVLSSPPQESLSPFLTIRQTLQDIGLSVPMLFATNKEEGLLLLSDFGSTQYADLLNQPKKVHDLYLYAFYPLIWMQRYLTPAACPITLSHFSAAFMTQQLDLFKVWYSERHLQHRLSTDAVQELDGLLQQLIGAVSKQPMVFSHMDYHSRNLMVLNKKHMPGILDFQDAMWAPCTLDLVSLLKDCYIHWPREQVVQWVQGFYQLKQRETAGALAVDFHTFLKWFDWTGVQRHLRILGTFSRLHYLHGKPAYLQYIPRIVTDLLDMSETYTELRSLQHFLK